MQSQALRPETPQIELQAKKRLTHTLHATLTIINLSSQKVWCSIDNSSWHLMNSSSFPIAPSVKWLHPHCACYETVSTAATDTPSLPPSPAATPHAPPTDSDLTLPFNGREMRNYPELFCPWFTSLSRPYHEFHTDGLQVSRVHCTLGRPLGIWYLLIAVWVQMKPHVRCECIAPGINFRPKQAAFVASNLLPRIC